MLTGVTCCFPRRPSPPKGSLEWLFGYWYGSFLYRVGKPHWRPRERLLRSQPHEKLVREAKDSTTSPERLKELIYRLDYFPTEMIESLAENPNTPSECLASLLNEVPLAVCRNPVLPLIALETPTFFASIKREVQEVLIRRTDTDPVILNLLAATTRHTDLRMEVLLHWRKRGDLPEEDWQDDVWGLLRWTAEQPVPVDARSDVLEAVELGLAPRWILGTEPFADSLDSDKRFQDLIRQHAPAPLHPCMDEEEVEEDGPTHLAAEYYPSYATVTDADDWWSRGIFGWREVESPEEGQPEPGWAAAAHSPDLIGSAQLRVVEDAQSGWFDQKWALAYHPDTPTRCLRILAEAPDAYLRRVVARHPNATDEVVDRCRSAVLQSEYMGIDVTLPYLLKLSLLMRRPVGEREQARAAHTLAEDPDFWMNRLIGVLAMPDATDESSEAVLRRLAEEDWNAVVRVAARARLRGESLAWEE